jgi:hypothetical protein
MYHAGPTLNLRHLSTAADTSEEKTAPDPLLSKHCAEEGQECECPSGFNIWYGEFPDFFGKRKDDNVGDHRRLETTTTHSSSTSDKVYKHIVSDGKKVTCNAATFEKSSTSSSSHRLLETTTDEEGDEEADYSCQCELVEEGHHLPISIDCTLFLFICLFAGGLIKQFANWTGIPYTSLITVFGIILGTFFHDDGRFGTAMKIWSEFDPHLMLFVFLPALIFESAFNSDFHIFNKIIYQCLMMAGPILLACTGLTAIM